MTIEPDDVDLEDLAERLEQLFGEAPPLGYLLGRTAIRDAVSAYLGCSDLQAEEIVDTMVGRGFLKYEGPTIEGIDQITPWRILARGDEG